MATEIERDATTILGVLYAAPRNDYVPAQAIAEATHLSVDRINDAMAALVDSNRAEWVQTMGTAPFDFGDAMITSRGRRVFQESTSQPPQSQRPSTPAPLPSNPRLFVSHAADDAELARRIVVLLSTALALPGKAIRCTSVDGYPNSPSSTSVASSEEELTHRPAKKRIMRGLTSFPGARRGSS